MALKFARFLGVAPIRTGWNITAVASISRANRRPGGKLGDPLNDAVAEAPSPVESGLS